MKIDITGKTNKFMTRALSDFSGQMILLLGKMPMEDISVQKICEASNYPRSTFYNYFYDIRDLMEYCFIAILKDMDMESHIRINEEQDTEELFSLMYDYLAKYKNQIHAILSQNGPDGQFMAALSAFMKQEIRKLVVSCPGSRDFPLREDVMVDFYAGTIEMLLEKCFFDKNSLAKEEAMESVRFLLCTLEKEAHRK